MEGKYQNTREIMWVRKLSIFRKIANEVIAKLVDFRQRVEKKRVQVIKEEFMVEEKFRQIAEIFTISPISNSIDFKNR